MPGPSNSNQAQQGDSANGQPLYPKLPPQPSAESDESDGEDTPGRKMTPTEKLKIIESILGAPDDAKKIQEAVEQALPSDVILNFRQIQAAIHSDRFPDPVEKEKATKAFQKLGFLRDNVGAKSSEVDKNNAFNFGNDPDRPQPHKEGKLSPYHVESHEKATPHLRVLFDALVNDPSFQPQPHKALTPAVKDAVSELDKINGLIREENAKNSQDSDLGIIRYNDLLAKWRPILMLDDEDTKKIVHQSLLAYCKQMHYPATWANQPPSSAPTSDRKEKAPESQSSPYVVTNAAGNKYANPQVPNQHGATSAAAPRLDPSGQQSYNGENIAAAVRGSNPPQTSILQNFSATSNPQAVAPNNGVTLQAVSGQKRVIAVKPRKTHRSVQPGFTSSGEKILFIQSLGVIGNARFVVTDAEGNVRLVSASSAGGQPALEGAKRTGIPYTIQDPTQIQELRDLVLNGGVYGLEFVAIGEWDMTKDRLPFIVVLFYHENENGRREAAISRSSLTKILAKREAERLVAESIVGNADMSLREALKSQISPGTQEQLSNNAPPLLPYREQTQPWWFQPTPQHYGSHIGFNTDPTQQPYASHFQQVVPQQFQQSLPQQFQQQAPQQYQQPFFHHYQAGPFAMPPQPIIDPSMMKNGGNSPAASLMEEEEL